jgi:hypothetical protein
LVASALATAPDTVSVATLAAAAMVAAALTLNPMPSLIIGVQKTMK